MPYQQNTKPAPNRHFVPLDRVKHEIIGVTGQNTEFYVGICTRAQEMHQNAANQSYFQVFKPFHLGLSGTINGTVARSNQFSVRVDGRYQDQFENDRKNESLFSANSAVEM